LAGIWKGANARARDDQGVGTSEPAGGGVSPIRRSRGKTERRGGTAGPTGRRPAPVARWTLRGHAALPCWRRGFPVSC